MRGSEKERNWVLTAFSLTVWRCSFWAEGVRVVLDFIPVCSRPFVWDSQQGGLNRSGNARRTSEVHPVDARQASLATVLISRLYACKFVCVCVGGWAWVCWWVFMMDGGENSLFSAHHQHHLSGAPSLPSRLPPATPTLMIYSCNGRGPQEGPGSLAFGGGGEDARQEGSRQRGGWTKISAIYLPAEW